MFKWVYESVLIKWQKSKKFAWKLICYLLIFLCKCSFWLDTFHRILLDVKNVPYWIKSSPDELRKNRSLVMDINSRIMNEVFPRHLWNSVTMQRGKQIHQIIFPLYRDLFPSSSEDEISLDKGIWVNILQKKSDGWWLIQYEKQRGWFPSNYLIEVNRKWYLLTWS